METGMKMIMDIVTGLTKIFVAFIGFGVVAGIVFGGNAFLVGDVLENLLGVVSMLGDAGIVGLLVKTLASNWKHTKQKADINSKPIQKLLNAKFEDKRPCLRNIW